MRKKNIYTVTYHATLPPGPAGALVETFDILLPRESFYLRSVIFDLLIYETLTFTKLPLATQTTQWYELDIGGIPNHAIAQFFSNFIVPANVMGNGNTIAIRKTGQINFENLFFSNNCHFAMQMNNLDLLQSYDYHWSLVAETESMK
jgi:hypothetical protein